MTHLRPPIPDYPTTTPIRIHAGDGWPAAVHRLGAKASAALCAAEATNRPLLIRGLPGVGKSMTARAAAHFARRPLLAHVIDSRTEPDDLKARFDPVRRLYEAQIPRGVNDPLPGPEHYLDPQVLWWAFDWDGALGQRCRMRGFERVDLVPADELRKMLPASVPDGWQPARDRVVVLLDEADKADPELPNALLEAMAANLFHVPATGQSVACDAARRPLVIVTTNEERELPSAFLRRTLVLWLTLPTDEAELVREWCQLAEEHQSWLLELKLRKGPCLVIEQAAKAVAASRAEYRDSGYQPGTSEFLDLVAALAELWPGDRDAQRARLDELREFVVRKAADAGG